MDLRHIAFGGSLLVCLSGCGGEDAEPEKKDHTFGNTVDRAEHCNVFAYYYPKTDDVNCF